jgi:hypothetical protein
VCVCVCVAAGVCVLVGRRRVLVHTASLRACVSSASLRACVSYVPQYALTLRRRYMYVSIYAAALGQVPDSTLDAKYKEDFKSGLALALAHPTDNQHRSIMQVSNACRNTCSLSLSLSFSPSLSLQCTCFICPKMHTHVRGAAGSASTLSRRKGMMKRP